MSKPARKVSETPKRTFHAQILMRYPQAAHKTIYVKDGWHLEPCAGSAHENPHIDGCTLCLGATWGWMLVKDGAEQP
jgi:hypothetical protein